MRRPVVAGNWKMNLLSGEALGLVAELKPLIAGVDTVDVILCPVSTQLRSVGEALAGTSIALGGQNCYLKEKGAYTGELSPQMLQDCGCTWTIIGHSERRQHFHEDNAVLNEKLRFALESGLKVMFCVGETLEERKGGQMKAVLEVQVRKGLAGLEEGAFAGLVLAYEPVWAIGTGETASPEQAQDAHVFVRGRVAEQFGETIAGTLRIQYGGSVKPDNASELMEQPDVDGALVGGASLQASDFAAIVKAAS